MMLWKRISDLSVSRFLRLPSGSKLVSGVAEATAEEVMSGANRTEIVTAANVITADENGKTFLLGSATGFASTLPLVAAGLNFTFVCSVAPTSGNHTVVPNAADDNKIFGAIATTDGNAATPAASEGSINFIANNALKGDHVQFWSDGINWFVTGVATVAAGVTATT
jgi:hypothetical protein